MKVKQAKILLEKINRLFQSMTMDDHVSEIEKELMRNYIKQMYESFLPDNGVAAPLTPPRAVVVEQPKAAPQRVEKIVEAPKVVEAPRVVAPPKVVEPPKQVKIETPPPPPPKVEVIPEPTPKPKPVPKVEKVVPVTPAPKPKPVAKSKVSEEHEELFEHKVAKELSEKLSQQPIKDLRKAMGINERILTTNELFDGNGDALKDTLSTLNNLSNFDEAKDYLSNIAGIYNWTTKKKKKKAQIFIKLVRRKFN